jgi:hypothetical protein
MKSGWNSLVVGGCNVVGLALLALSVTGGGSAVRAAGDSASVESIALESFAKMASTVEQRIAALETSVGAFAHSLTAVRVAARELCVADDSGAQTCITKAQLDLLLKQALQTAQITPPGEPVQTAPAIEPRHEPGACTEKCIAPTAAAPSETPAANEPPAASAAATKETTPSAAAPVPPAAASVPEQPQAAAGSVAGAPAPADADVAASAAPPKTAEKSSETVIATAAPAAAMVPAETAGQVEHPANAEPANTTAAALADTKDAPREAPQVSDSKE